MTDQVVQPILVAACGNTLAGDDAFGPLVARELSQKALFGVEVIDLGMRPAGLIDHLPGRRAVILVDAAVCPEAAPGALLDMDFFAPARPTLCAARIARTPALSLAGQLELARALGMLPAIVRLVALVVENTQVGRPGTRASQMVSDAAALIERQVRNF